MWYGLKCEDCFNYDDRCEIVWRWKETVERYQREEEEIEQLRIGEDPTKSKEKLIAHRRMAIKEINEIKREMQKCLKRRAFNAIELGHKLFKNQSELDIQDCYLCVHRNKLRGTCSLNHKRKYKRWGFCKDFEVLSADS